MNNNNTKLLFIVFTFACVVLTAPTNSRPKAKKDDLVIIVTNALTNPNITSTTTEEINKEFPAPSQYNDTYPLLKPIPGVLEDQKYGIAPPPHIDPELKNLDGINEKPIYFGNFANSTNTMEKKTPLFDLQPCYPNRVLKVVVLPAEYKLSEYPILPSRYGCATGKDTSREKASPAIQWSGFNISELTDFSLQMISMGDEKCTGQGTDGYNRIHWHITGIKPTSTVVTLEEGASHDPRLLYGGHELPNQWLEEYYAGPCPPPGAAECFRFKVLAHLNDGRQCFCGHQDVVFQRPMPPKNDEVPWSYTPDPISKTKRV